MATAAGITAWLRASMKLMPGCELTWLMLYMSHMSRMTHSAHHRYASANHVHPKGMAYSNNARRIDRLTDCWQFQQSTPVWTNLRAVVESAQHSRAHLFANHFATGCVSKVEVVEMTNECGRVLSSHFLQQPACIPKTRWFKFNVQVPQGGAGGTHPYILHPSTCAQRS